MDASRTAVRSYRLLFGVLGLVAVVGTYLTGNDNPGFSSWNYFSYFTIQSNILIALLLVGLAVRPDTRGRWDVVRGAFALYILITGLIYNGLLRGVDVQVDVDVFNEVLHTVMPLVGIIDWVLVAPLVMIGSVRSLVFLVYPFAYLVYSLVRGPFVDWYPYPFLDPRLDGGYGRVALWCVVLFVVMALLALGVGAAGRWAARRRTRSAIVPPVTRST